MIQMKKLTPVLVVEEIEPCLSFWSDRLGFEKTVEVPEGDKLGFVILAKDSVEVMYQSRASVRMDVPALGEESFRSALYIEIGGLNEVIQKLAGAEIVVPLRETFYGMREISVREPAGNIVAFAEKI